MDGTHSMVFTAVQDLGPGATPGIKQMHLFFLGFTNPEAGRGASPVVSGNTVCGSATNLDIKEGAEPDLGENDICPDETSE